MKNIRETMPRLHSAIVSYFSGVASRIPQENIDDRNMIVQLAKKGKYDLAHLLCVRDKVAPKQYRGYDYFPVKLFSQNIEQRINTVEDKKQEEKYLKKSFGIDVGQLTKDITEALNNDANRNKMKRYLTDNKNERPDFLDPILERYGIVRLCGEDTGKALLSILPYIATKVKSVYTGANVGKNEILPQQLAPFVRKLTSAAPSVVSPDSEPAPSTVAPSVVSPDSEPALSTVAPSVVSPDSEPALSTVTTVSPDTETDVPSAIDIKTLPDLGLAIHYLATDEDEGTDEKHQIRKQVSKILQNSGISFAQRQAIIKFGKINTEHADAIRNHLASLSSGADSDSTVGGGTGPGVDAVGPGDTSTSSDAADAAKRDADAADAAKRDADAADAAKRDADAADAAKRDADAADAAKRDADAADAAKRDADAADAAKRDADAADAAKRDADAADAAKRDADAADAARRAASPASPSGEYAHKDYSYYTKMTFDDFRKYIKKIYADGSKKPEDNPSGVTLKELQHIEEVFGLGDKTSSDPNKIHPLLSQARLNPAALTGIFTKDDHIRNFASATPSGRRDPADPAGTKEPEELETASEGTTPTVAAPLAAKFSFSADPLPSYVTTKGMDVDAELAKIKKDYDTKISGLSTARASDAEKIKAETEAGLKVKKLLGWQETADSTGVDILNPSVATKLHLPEHRELASIIDANSILTNKKSVPKGTMGHRPRIGDLALAQLGGWDADALKQHATEAISKLPDYQIRERLRRLHNATDKFTNVHADQLEGINRLLAEARTRNLSGIIPMPEDSLGTAGAVRPNRMTNEQHAALNAKMDDYISGGSAVTANPDAVIRSGASPSASDHPVVGPFNNYSVTPNAKKGLGRGGPREGTGPKLVDVGLGISVGQFKRIFSGIDTSSFNDATDILKAPQKNEVLKNIRMLYVIASSMKMKGISSSEISKFVKHDRAFRPVFDEEFVKNGGRALAVAISGAIVAKQFSDTSAISKIEIPQKLDDLSNALEKHMQLRQSKRGTAPADLPHNQQLGGSLVKEEDGNVLWKGLELIKDFFPKSSPSRDIVKDHPHPGNSKAEITIDPTTKRGTSSAINQYVITHPRGSDTRQVNFFNIIPELHPAIRDHFFTLLDQINVPALQRMTRLNYLSPAQSHKKRGGYDPVVTDDAIKKVKEDILKGDYQSVYKFFNTLRFRAEETGIKGLTNEINSSLKVFHDPASTAVNSNPFEKTSKTGFHVAAKHFINNAKDKEGNFIFGEDFRNLDLISRALFSEIRDQHVGKSTDDIADNQGMRYLASQFWGNPADHDKKTTEKVIDPTQFTAALAADHSLNAWHKVLNDEDRKIGITLKDGVPVRAGRINADSQVKLILPKGRLDKPKVKRHVFDMIHPALEAAVYAHGPWSEATDEEKAAHVEKLKELGRFFGKDGESTFTSILDAKPTEYDKQSEKRDGTSELHVGEDEDGMPAPIKDSDGNHMTVKDAKFEFDAGHPWHGYDIGWLREQNGSPNGPKLQVGPNPGYSRSRRSLNTAFLAGKVKESVPLFTTIPYEKYGIVVPKTYLTPEAKRLHDHVYENLGKKADDTTGKLKYLLKDGISQAREDATPEESDTEDSVPAASKKSDLFDTPYIDMHGRVDASRVTPVEIHRPQLETHPVTGTTHADIIHAGIAEKAIVKSFSIPTLAFALRKSKESIALKKALMYAKLHQNVERAFESKKAREGTFLYGR